ncbi:hypothetical protein JY651_42030 [Pyxidicoccus parkwayensis]|uniref:Lipoprotein n=1 Tax=Pyxidicoccus parkwayensis TaxID=2813578 RepID=A0ABX7NT73_9BACT|nr:hypothetical protein [Pyxidicoccus parkwaysis]QSQ21673.1 hypothetical protein JY651_42030 [Pyxidicoccus parkwaysis]
MRNALPCLAAAWGLGSACATIPTVERDGFLLGLQSWDNDERTIRSQASFKTSCPADQLQLRVLSSTTPPTIAGDARGVAVTGCGQKTSWVGLGSGIWSFNGNATAAQSQ